MSLPDRAWGHDDCVENVGNVSGSYGGNRPFRYSCSGIFQITTAKLLLHLNNFRLQYNVSCDDLPFIHR